MKHVPTPLVSVVVPVYNAGDFVGSAIKSVQEQTYGNWELLLVDDCSVDNSAAIIRKTGRTDSRIKLVTSGENKGVAHARNMGVAAARGRYIAFLDADDTWRPRKLEKQVSFMLENGHTFTFAGYEFTDRQLRPTGKVVHVPNQMSKMDYLKNNLIWTSTVMIDIKHIDKKTLKMSNISYGEDALTWCAILGKVEFAHGLDEITAYYRRASSSLSGNKLQATLKKLQLYWSIHDLSPWQRLVYCGMSLTAAARKRV